MREALFLLGKRVGAVFGEAFGYLVGGEPLLRIDVQFFENVGNRRFGKIRCLLRPGHVVNLVTVRLNREPDIVAEV